MRRGANLLIMRVDPEAGSWPSESVINLGKLANKCLEDDREKRLDMTAVSLVKRTHHSYCTFSIYRGSGPMWGTLQAIVLSLYLDLPTSILVLMNCTVCKLLV